MITTSFIGLGVMGYPMAGHLAQAGHTVTVYNRTRAKAKAWTDEHGGTQTATPAEAAASADMTFVCVGNDDDLGAVILGDNGALSTMRPGAILIDHTTASASAAREINKAARTAGVDFLDAPVSGGQAGAEGGTLTVMAGGGEGAFERAKPVIGAYARAVTLMGPAGCGQLTKMVNQICVAGVVQGLAEGLNFAVRAGLDANLALDVISKGAAASWQMENRGETMLEDAFDFGFAVDWMVKDLGICLAEAGNNGARLPVTEIIRGYYTRLQEMGGGRWDTSSLIRLLSKD
jgi:3-hydroxyisobutyrate dehydrogenase-like beta-hydroxyacid dehydrogenase